MTSSSSYEIGVVCPTRNRLDRAIDLYRSLKATSGQARLLYYIDDDQKEAYAPLETVAQDAGFLYGPKVGPCDSVNRLVAHFPEHTIYGVAPDDSLFLTQAWDQWLIDKFNSFPGRLGVVSPSHDLGDFVNFPFVSREWIEVLGWFAYPTAYHFIWDTVLELLGDATRICYAPGEKFSMKNLAMPPTDYEECFQKDCQGFLWWSVGERKKMIVKMRAAMTAQGAVFP